MSFEETEDLLALMRVFMDSVHEALPGKDNLKARERALIPFRKRCVIVGYARYELALRGKLVCSYCHGTGWRKFDRTHDVVCAECCKHDQGWWLLEKYYGADNGKWCCIAGCGTKREDMK